jgi:DnaJ family protein C protein 9
VINGGEGCGRTRRYEGLEGIRMPSVPFDIEGLDLYDLLSVAKESTGAQIKKAYRLAALKYHPDKAKDDKEKAEFHDKFQKIVFAYGVLSDEKRRSRYDKTGSLEDYDDDDASLADMFNDLYQSNISKEMVEEDKKNYQGSQEEVDDILEALEEGEGSLDYVFESVPHSSVLDDEDRFVQIIKDNADKQAKAYKNFLKETKQSKTKRKSKAQKEAEEAEQMAKELGLNEAKAKTGEDGESPLELMIRENQKKRMDLANSRMDRLISKVEEKHNPKKKKSSKAPSEPSEEDFKRMEERATKAKTQKSKVTK